MPYIQESNRQSLEEHFDIDQPETSGELNYLITGLVQVWLGKHYNYDRLNAAIGVLESAKLELYRRSVAPYEDRKMAENGDVNLTGADR